MNSDEFKVGMVELYQGEILGEVLFDQMLSYFDQPEQQYKIAVMLQLETETKARLRPAMIQLGLDLAEQPQFRNMGQEMADALKGKSWQQTIIMIRDVVKPAVERYREIAASAPAQYQALANGMVNHEQSIVDFAELELAGEGERSVEAIDAQLQNKLPRTSD